MNTQDRNKLIMYRTVADLCEKPAFQPVWSTLPAFVATFGELKANTQELEALTLRANVAAATRDKEKAHHDLATRAYQICGLVRAVAVATNRPGLEERVSFSRTEFKDSRGVVTVHRARQVLAAAEEVVAELAPANITEQSLQDYAEQVKAYEQSAIGPRSTTVQRKANNERIKVLVRFIDVLLKRRLDPLVNLFEQTHPDFFLAYRNARVVVDTPATRGGEDENEDSADDESSAPAANPAASDANAAQAATNPATD
jgi:hypothetical protein